MMQSDAVLEAPAIECPRARTSFFRMTLMPLFLLIVCPPIVLIGYAFVLRLDSSFERVLSHDGLQTVLANIPRPSWMAAQILAVFTASALVLLFFLPGPTLLGPMTPTGNRPAYRLNGVAAFAATHALFWLGVALHLYPASVIYDHFGALLATLCIFALGFCVLLYIKGYFFPTNADRTITGNPIFDYFQGTELHPRLFGVDLKQLCNSRLSMMSWPLIVVSFAAAQYAQYGRVSSGMAVAVALQTAYIFKFFMWEGGYFASLDITHDRFGFYICWGVLCWVPFLYTLGTLFLVNRPSDLPVPLALLLLAFGLASLAINYLADRQRQRVRSTGGQTTVWGRKPRLIEASYTTSDGKEQSNLLLASGYWGIARHFHYVPELLLALAWTLPAGHTRVLPYFYFTFLFILLVDRAGRDDRRCEAKYGQAWHEYRRAVPYKILPGVY